MKLTRQEVIHIANLARLTLTDAEIALYQEQLSAVLAYAARLQTLDTGDISPTATISPALDVMRGDKPRPSMARDDILSNAPQVEDGRFRVQAVLE